jgi:hypothetical protein
VSAPTLLRDFHVGVVAGALVPLGHRMATPSRS